MEGEVSSRRSTFYLDYYDKIENIFDYEDFYSILS